MVAYWIMNGSYVVDLSMMIYVQSKNEDPLAFVNLL